MDLQSHKHDAKKTDLAICSSVNGVSGYNVWLSCLAKYWNTFWLALLCLVFTNPVTILPLNGLFFNSCS